IALYCFKSASGGGFVESSQIEHPDPSENRGKGNAELVRYGCQKIVFNSVCLFCFLSSFALAFEQSGARLFNSIPLYCHSEQVGDSLNKIYIVFGKEPLFCRMSADNTERAIFAIYYCAYSADHAVIEQQ